MQETIDYSQTGFIIPIERDHVRGYASINHEFVREEDELDFTGNYIVYLLHPVKGSIQFKLEPDEKEKWVMATEVKPGINVDDTEDSVIDALLAFADVPVKVEEDILGEIIQAIELRRHAAGASVNVSSN